MLRLILTRFWPVLLPIVIYLLWRWWRARQARKYGADAVTWTRSHVYWIVLSSLLIGIACMLFLGLTAQHNHGAYIPTMEENGKLVPGHWEEQ